MTSAEWTRGRLRESAASPLVGFAALLSGLSFRATKAAFATAFFPKLALANQHAIPITVKPVA